MNDELTPEERRQRWVRAVDTATAHGWKHVTGWHFRSPSGTLHDLSASDLEKLDLIESEKLNGRSLVVHARPKPHSPR